MKEFVFKEYTTTTHYDNRTGVRASCPDCHVPRVWAYKVARKVLATNELFHWLKGTIDTPEKFEIRRPVLARKVWASMEATDSRECRNCHGIGFMKHTEQTAAASVMHSLGEEWNKTCIDCHKGIAHNLPRDYDKNLLMDELHDRMEEKQIECRLCHEDIAAPPSGEEW
jgi:cytochrome c-type protein NapC